MDQNLDSLIDFFNEEMYITSDHHFKHKNMLKFEPIREELQEKYNKTIEQIMMERWNEVVPKNANVFHLGDFSWGDPMDYGPTLTGNKILLQGNHDNYPFHKYNEAGFISIINFQAAVIDGEIEVIKTDIEDGEACIIADIGDSRILFSHIPMLIISQYDDKYKGKALYLENLFDEYDCDFNIHGHIHRNKTHKKYCYNVSVDAVDFKPIPLKDIIAKFN